MRYIRYCQATPEEHLALDELLLSKAEKGEIGQSLRIWMADRYFIALGRAGKAGRECRLQECRADRVPVLRRCSGGGTVLQGPGCLNYSIVLSVSHKLASRNIKQSYRKILSGLCSAFHRKGIPLKFHPVSDLAHEGRKVSGNAQKRGRSYFLHHGSILMAMDLERIEHYINEPPEQPAYRKGRRHRDFVANLQIERAVLEDVVSGYFCSGDTYETVTLDEQIKVELEELVRSKYSDPEWNFSLL